MVQFSGGSRITIDKSPINSVPTSLSYGGGGTQFHPASIKACQLARETPQSHTPLIVFMSDGGAGDASAAAQQFSALNTSVLQSSGQDLQLHVISFGGGTDQAQLNLIANASKTGKVHTSANISDLANVFVNIASTQDVTTLLEPEVAK